MKIAQLLPEASSLGTDEDKASDNEVIAAVDMMNIDGGKSSERSGQ